ncbi:hypothetical protein Vadar_023791 [Vaccinium darrowii]|uniref:Uncharacterized protein n=1 Tax=Vaccinium darrowii TaxID=229202 RepID=A0ACB7YFM3_9ERIC|nr:hypothetical protein Vadar_023791 [Vaccinium darrowii]
MDMKPNFVKNGGLFRIPIGFRFHPTDEELLVHYLKPKVHSVPLPAAVIPELDVFHSNPWDLPGDSKEKRYFFSKRNRNANECNRISTGSGYWKGIGKEKYIVASGSDQRAIGVRKTMVFYQAKRRRPRGFSTHWIMHEFQLMGSVTTPNTYQKLITEMEDWVVCCIYQKKAKSKRSTVAKNGNTSSKLGKIRPCVLNMIVEDKSDSGPQPSSSSCSSEITEISSKGSDHEEDFNQ